MAAVILQWNPEHSAWPGTHPADIETVRRTGVVRKRWPVQQRPTAAEGTDAWLLVRGKRPELTGLLGHGIVAGPSIATSTKDTPYCVDIDFDILLPQGDHVALPPAISSEWPDGTGGLRAVVDSADELALRVAWAEALSPHAGSLHPVPGALPATAVRRTLGNAFEQDADLRRIALAHRGSVCHACALDFEQTYGPVGKDLVDVHHITPLAHIDAHYEPDPLVDLIPLCHNCHAVAHSRSPDPYSVQEIKDLLRKGGFLPGSVMTAEHLQLEAAAARLLGG